MHLLRLTQTATDDASWRIELALEREGAPRQTATAARAGPTTWSTSVPPGRGLQAGSSTATFPRICRQGDAVTGLRT